MMQYIHQNFRQNLTLEDIAGQAMVSKSTALNLFRRYLHDTPVHYVVKVSSAGGCKASGYDGEKDNCNFRRDGIRKYGLFLQDI